MKIDSEPNFEKSMIRGNSRKKSTRTTNTKVSLLDSYLNSVLCNRQMYKLIINSFFLKESYFWKFRYRIT